MADNRKRLTRRELLQRSGGYSVAVLTLLSGSTLGGCDKDDPEAAFCNDTCAYSSDLACDDGAPGSSYSLCNFGTDCTDCGVRYGSPSYSNAYSNYSNAYSNYSNVYYNVYYNYSNVYYNAYYNYSNAYYNAYYNYFVNSW